MFWLFNWVHNVTVSLSMGHISFTDAIIFGLLLGASFILFDLLTE